MCTFFIDRRIEFRDQLNTLNERVNGSQFIRRVIIC